MNMDKKGEVKPKKTKVCVCQSKPKSDDISLCPHCNCMTHTIKGICGKCGKPKSECGGGMSREQYFDKPKPEEDVAKLKKDFLSCTVKLELENEKYREALERVFNLVNGSDADDKVYWKVLDIIKKALGDK